MTRACPCCKKPFTQTDEILLRLRVPATPTELSKALNIPLRTVRSILGQKLAVGLVKRLDRGIKREGRGPRIEKLWETA